MATFLLFRLNAYDDSLDVPDMLILRKVEGNQTVVNGVGIKAWLGVPFGAAPVGNLRWKPVRNDAFNTALEIK